MNLYQYASNDPINNWDPNGFSDEKYTRKEKILYEFGGGRKARDKLAEKLLKAYGEYQDGELIQAEFEGIRREIMNVRIPATYAIEETVLNVGDSLNKGRKGPVNAAKKIIIEEVVEHVELVVESKKTDETATQNTTSPQEEQANKQKKETTRKKKKEAKQQPKQKATRKELDNAFKGPNRTAKPHDKEDKDTIGRK